MPQAQKLIRAANTSNNDYSRLMIATEICCPYMAGKAPKIFVRRVPRAALATASASKRTHTDTPSCSFQRCIKLFLCILHDYGYCALTTALLIRLHNQ